MTWPRRLALLAPGLLVGTSIALSPTPAGGWVYPLGQRLLYVHVPLAWAAYAGFLAAAAVAVLVLARHRGQAWLVALVETTTVFAAAALATGLAWSYEFAFDPLQDPKVLTTLVLVAALAGLWTLSASVPAPRRDRLLASLSLVALVTVPASYLASRLATPHPDFATETSISTTMALLLTLSTLGFTLLLGGLAHLRARLVRRQEGMDPW